METRRRVLFLDLLKIISALAVICIHVSAAHMRNAGPFDSEYQLNLLLDSLVRWCVPMFVMVSGALMLRDSNSEIIEERKIGFPAKRIVQVACLYLAWSLFYAVVQVCAHGWPGMTQFVSSVISGKYHLWYLVMLLGLYFLLPMARLVSAHDGLARYAARVLCGFASLRVVAPLLPFESAVTALLSDFSFYAGYLGYFLLGRILFVRPLEKGKAFLLFLISLGANSALVMTTAAAGQSYLNALFDYLSPLVIVQAASLFSVASYAEPALQGLSPTALRLVRELSLNGLGVYLVHLFVMELIVTPSAAPLYSVFIEVALVFVVSHVVVSFLRRVPIVRALFLA